MDHPHHQPHFFVVIPCYNYGRYLARAVDSVLAQEGTSFEVLVIDDGSTDDTREVAAGYAARIGYRHQSRQGPYAACRQGVLQAPPRSWVVFLDADDRMRPGYLQAVGDVLRRKPHTRVFFPKIVNVAADGREKASPLAVLESDPLINFDNYVSGRLGVSAGGAVMARSTFDRPLDVFEPFVPFHGFDRVLIAQALAHHAAAVAEGAVLEVHEHEGRLREDVDAFLDAGLAALDALFDPRLLPGEAMRYRNAFRCRLLLEQGRLLYRHRQYRQARERLSQAMRASPTMAVRPRQLRRWAVSALAGLFPGSKQIPRPLPADSAAPTGEAS